MNEELRARLEELRALVDQARSMPMSASVMLNRSDLTDRLDRLERAVESSVSDATGVLGERDALVAAGREQAAEITRQAERERDKLVSDTDVYRLAQQRGQEIRAEAERETRELRAETDVYVESALANFELTLERTLDAVKRGRARLTGGHAAGLGDDSDVADIALPEHLRR